MASDLTGDASRSLRVAETDLRWLVRSVMRSVHGADWLNKSGLSEGRVELASAAMGSTAKPSVLPSEADTLDYTQLWDLETVILKNWNHFDVVLGPKAEFKVFLKRLIEYRNPDAHSRQLLPFQAALVIGIAGEIRNRVTVYRSTMAPDGNYYPKIEKITDSFGRVWQPDPKGDTNLFNILPTVRLAVGQVVTFICRGWDPQGRDLRWNLQWQTVGVHSFDSAVGSEVSLAMETTEVHVGDFFLVAVTLTSSGKYHRNPVGTDDSVQFRFEVVPPDA